MTKYSSEERQMAEAEIRNLLRQGLTYHRAAMRVSEHSAIRWVSRPRRTE